MRNMADNKIFWSSQPILPIGNPAANRVQRDEKQTSDFADILAGQETKVKFSKHANERLRDRQIDLSDQQRHELPMFVCKDGECIFPSDVENSTKIIYVKPFKTNY